MEASIVSRGSHVRTEEQLQARSVELLKNNTHRLRAVGIRHTKLRSLKRTKRGSLAALRRQRNNVLKGRVAHVLPRTSRVKQIGRRLSANRGKEVVTVINYKGRVSSEH